MKTTKRTFGKLLALALVFLFALTAAVPVFAEPADPENLTVTIRNNEGLPAMTEDQFEVYQIFKGTANREGNAESNEWNAFSWDNYTLADIEWGESMTHNAIVTLKTYLYAADWAEDGDIENVFKEWALAASPKGTAAELAEILVGKDNAFLQNFAKTVLAVPALKTVTLPEPETDDEKNPKLNPGAADSAADDSLTFTLPDPGYYLFAENPAAHSGDEHKDDAVSEYMLAVVGAQDILLKASVPTVDKDIVVDGGDKKGDVDGVGDEVTFKLTGTLPKNFGDFDTYYYQFTDILSEGLSLNTGSFTVTVVMDGKTYTIDSTEYGVLPQGTLLDPPGTATTIMVVFTDLINGSNNVKGLKYTAVTPTEDVAPTGEVALDSTAQVLVTYKATVNTDAVIGANGNPNDVDLTYSNDPNSDSKGKTEKKTVYVYAFGLDLTKVGDDEDHKSGLSGAGFVLKDAEGNYAMFKDQWVIETTNDDGSKTTTFSDTKVEASDENQKVTGPVRRLTGWATDTGFVKQWLDALDDAEKQLEKASNADKADAQEAVNKLKEALSVYLLESGEHGEIPDIYGLDEGEYTLEEVITPAGYNTMEDFDIKIEAQINDKTGKLEKVTYTHDGENVVYSPNDSDYDPELDPDEKTDLKARFESGLLKDDIVNQKAPFLPFTGGIGTTIFYVLGTLLIAGAVTYLVIATKKRKSAE